MKSRKVVPWEGGGVNGTLPKRISIHGYVNVWQMTACFVPAFWSLSTLFLFFHNQHVILESAMDIWIQISSYGIIMKAAIIISYLNFLMTPENQLIAIVSGICIKISLDFHCSLLWTHNS
jgi:hypothetical protein